MTLEKLSESKCHGGMQQVWRHDSATTGTPMTFAVFQPEHRATEKLPVLWWLSGLTCTHENAMIKCEYKAACAAHGIVFICPDTSPRGEGVPNHEDYDFGQGAGFYVDATQDPWSRHFQMKSYIEDELPGVVAGAFDVDMDRQGISGHSMGGHGALTVSLRNPGRFRSTSAFAPIVSPLNCPWGEKALTGYLGDDRQAWRQYDSVALIEDGARLAEVLIDQGRADEWLEPELKTHLFEDACRKAGMTPTVRMQDGYDHSYFFVSTFIADHVAWHAERLKA
ncbi:S-formylglutathione hydrolase [Erythrobacter arachoides]|uniref:S-formylglutathione hydrolase n=1 Tax=Aurantiacibacter arachoides TaxID=1850444 RepID=A0A845A2H5_9SPHN|nr:S-formylglutathione hydrolase [Aurantiacibacter arachoides]MXO94345.1 S-formylglutathione hydrolase [Aurantiacibacter arachoides]GGD64216.1 S-formylglutathione hydrolase [Aurantiacibacter arachoides]